MNIKDVKSLIPVCLAVASYGASDMFDILNPPNREYEIPVQRVKNRGRRTRRKLRKIEKRIGESVARQAKALLIMRKKQARKKEVRDE